MHLPINSTLQAGKYKIVRFISAGGFGCTYEAIHTGFDERVAIKEFFVKDFCNRDEETAHVTIGTTSKVALVKKLQKKFVDEARAIRHLKHNNIVEVSDVFQENGTAYYVMEYIDGLSLNDYVKKYGRLKEEAAVSFIKQVAEALRYVHSQNRLHLDIKPGNIMVNSNGKAVLIDFGASKQYDEEAGENTSTLLGKTPGYAPPEQMGNNIVKFYASTDIYALGATFYKILTGITPPSATLLASGESLKPLPAYISENVRNAIAKAMQINKDKRPQSIDEFLKILNPPEEDVTVIGGGEKEGGDDKTEVVNEKEKKSKVKQVFQNISKTKLIAAMCVAALVLGGGIGIAIYNDSSSTQSVPAENAVSIDNVERLADVMNNRTEHVTGQTFKDASGKEFTYTGEVKDGKPNGKGMGVYSYGTYVGTYQNGVRHGDGKFESKDGSNKYEGTFANDKYDTGKLTMSDGYYFDGTFKDGQPYNGSWYDKSGKLDSKVVNGN